MSDEAYFVLDGDRYMPTDRSLGPWGRDTLHGGPVAAALAHAVERQRTDGGLIPARLSVDLLRAVPATPLLARSRVLRESSRLRVVEVVLESEGTDVSRAVGLLLAPSEEPDADAPQRAPTLLPPPNELPLVPMPEKPVSHGTSLELRGEVQADGPTLGGGVWIRAPYPIIAGEFSSPFCRAALASDWANPVANLGRSGLRYVNADVTLYLHREPVGEWIGLARPFRQSADGICLCECGLQDERGPVGTCMTVALAARGVARANRPRGA